MNIIIDPCDSEAQPMLTRENSTTNYREKRMILKNTLDDILKKKIKHTKIYIELKALSDILNVILHIFNAMSVCSIILTFSDVNMVINILALSTSSCSSILSAATTALGLSVKMHNHNSAALQYMDVFRDMTLRLHKNGLSSGGLDILISELNIRLALIEDSAPLF